MDPVSTEKSSVPGRSHHPLITVACLVVIIWGAKASAELFVPLLLAATLAFMGAPVVRHLQRLKVPNGAAVAIATTIFIAPLASAIFGVIYQLQALLADYPGMVKFVDRHLLAISSSEWAHNIGIGQSLTVADLSVRLSESAGEGLHFVGTALQAIASAASETVLVAIFAVLMLALRGHLYRCAHNILSRWDGIQASKMLEVTTSLVEKFLLTKLIVAVSIGIASAIGLWAVGVHYSYLLGGLVGLMTLIPTVGFILCLPPVAIVALSTGAGMGQTSLAIGVLTVIHLVEANVLTPRLVGQRLNLNALATFVGLFAGGLLWGVWGMFLSVPILGVMRISFSVSPTLAPWGELLAERDDRKLIATLVTQRVRVALRDSRLRARARRKSEVEPTATTEPTLTAPT